MRKRVYTINVNIKEGKEKVDEIKQAAKEKGLSASRYLVYAHACLLLKKTLETPTEVTP